MTDLLELAARCEAAEGPDRAIDVAIWRIVNPVHASIVESWARDGKGDEPPETWMRAFTASLDAAMQLVPEGWSFAVNHSENRLHSTASLGRSYPTNKNAYGEASTPALALCIAALRARGSAQA